jgi:hypothetical protein
VGTLEPPELALNVLVRLFALGLELAAVVDAVVVVVATPLACSPDKPCAFPLPLPLFVGVNGCRGCTGLVGVGVLRAKWEVKDAPNLGDPFEDESKRADSAAETGGDNIESGGNGFVPLCSGDAPGLTGTGALGGGRTDVEDGEPIEYGEESGAVNVYAEKGV